MSTAELKQLQQTEVSPIAVARDSVLTGAAPDPLLVNTSGLELKVFLTLEKTCGNVYIIPNHLIDLF